jgi:NADPH:quinone reductase-like Zn-dependent oxidoreductase
MALSSRVCKRILPLAKSNHRTLTSTSDPDWPAQVRKSFGGPASVVLEAVGGALVNDLFGLIKDGGTVISYGSLSRPTTPLNAIALRGVTVGRWGLLSAEQRAADVAFALDLAQTRPDLFGVAGAYDLADYGAAIDEVTRPGKVGTVLLTSFFD